MDMKIFLLVNPPPPPTTAFSWESKNGKKNTHTKLERIGQKYFMKLYFGQSIY